MKKYNRYLLNQIQNILIIDEFYVAPVNLLLGVLLLLHLEDMLYIKSCVKLELLKSSKLKFKNLAKPG